MTDQKFTKYIMLFIIIQPFFDIFVYLIDDVIGLSIPFISLIRPLIAGLIFLYLLFNKKVSSKAKKISFIYLLIYALYAIIHLFNIRHNFTAISDGNLMGEIRYLANYGYYLLQLINFYLLFKIIDKDTKRQILISFTIAACSIAVLYFIALFTKTSPITYPYSPDKMGWKGWSISAHYVGHSLLYSLPVILYVLFEKKYLKGWLKYLIVLLLIVPSVYLIGTKTPLFLTLGIILFYTFLKLIEGIKNRQITKDIIFFSLISLLIIGTFTLTFGYSNYEMQKGNVSENGGKIEPPDEEEMDPTLYDRTLKKYPDNQILKALVKYENINTSVFDNRSIQKIINNEIRRTSPLNDKLFGYGIKTMPTGTWVETDFHTIYYCYGLIGLLLIIIIPFGLMALNGLKCLLNIKKMNNSKFILGLGFGMCLVIDYAVGYTLQFSQTVFYMIILLVVANEEFIQVPSYKKKKDYLFAINDLNIGGAEVGMVDVVNELVSKGKTVDIVLLRKRGPLLSKLNSKVEVHEILNANYSSVKQKLYHVLYMLGGPFIKYVYNHTITTAYQTEVAYLEGFPAVFIAASSNPESTKVASIRVGLKNHKLKAHKLPWGEHAVKKAYQKMDNIYTVSDLTTAEFLEKYPFCRDKTTTIYTYFNKEDIEKQAQEKYDYQFAKDKINFLAIGRFNSQKSYDRLIEAFAQVATTNPHIMLHFLGNDATSEGDKVKALIKEKKLSDKVILHGVKTNPYPYIKDCDCLVSSSLYEGFPRVINEALCLKKLCIGTNVTGTKEALQNGKLGLLVDDSVEGLVKGLKEVIDNPQLYAKYQKEIAKFDGNKESFFKGLEEISSKKPSMVIYMPKLSFGGMEKALVNLINYGKLNAKYRLTLYLIYKGDMNYLDLLPSNINVVIACPGKWDIKGKIIASLKLGLRYISSIFNNYDLAISYSYQHPVLTTLTRLSSENNIVYIHSNLTDGVDPKILHKRIKKCKYEKFKKIICVSYDTKANLETLINRHEDIYVLNNIIDGDNILVKAEEKVTDYDFKPKLIRFCNICRHYEEHKKLMRIIKATSKLNKEGFKFEVLFIGDGIDHKLYQKEIKKLNLNNIKLLGKKSNPYKYLQNSDALLLSSIREGYPVVFVESMVLNKPIVTTNISDAKKDIAGKYGIVVNNDDEAIYEGMKEFLTKGFKIKEKFDYEKFNNEIKDQLYEIYNK